MIKEIYKTLEDFPEYQVSNRGNVKSSKSGDIKLLHPSLNKTRGYVYISVQANGKRKNYSLHRLVAKYFVPNPMNKEEVNHKDMDRTNNEVSNLEWVTRSENQLHAFQNGRKSPVGNVKYTDEFIRDIRRYRAEGYKIREISKQLNVPISTVTHICLGTRRKPVEN